MKTTKRFLAAMVAVASVMAIAPMSAFAEDTVINQGSTNKSGTMTVSYLQNAVSPTYTITIPATVDLNSTTHTANITAEGVYLDTNQHKQINVTLDSASHTDSGATFHAQNTARDSTATYTINNGTKDIAVGDVVASFANNPDTTADPDVQTATLTFSEPTGATYAGVHTETLTFGISVEDAVTTPTVGTVFPIGTADLGDYYYWNHEMDADRLSKKFRNFGNATISISSNYSHPTLGNYRVISIVSSTAQYIDWEMTQMDPTGPWATWQNSNSFNYFKVDNYDTTPTGIRIASGSGTEDDPFTFELVFD